MFAIPVYVVHAVTISRDNWDLAVMWAAIIGTPLAALAIVFAAVTLWKANKDRKDQFELEVLTKLIETCTLAPYGSLPLARAQVSMLPDADVPRLREQIMTVGIAGNDQIGDYTDELLAAIRKYK